MAYRESAKLKEELNAKLQRFLANQPSQVALAARSLTRTY